MVDKFKMKQKMNDGSYRELQMEVPIKQVEEVNVVAPKTVDISIKDDGSFRRPSIEVLKMQAGNAQTVTMDFDAADAAKFIVGGESADQSPYVTFDGTMKLVTEYDVETSEPEALSTGMMSATNEIDLTSFKNIEKITMDIESEIGIKQIVVGRNSAAFCLVLLNDGTVKAWGYNNRGQLGLGDTTDRLTPTLIPNLTNVKQIALGEAFCLALLNDGTVKTWGYNSAGVLGLGDTTDRLTPTLIPDLTNVKQIAAGNLSAYAVLNDGTAKSWGDSSYFQHGLGHNRDQLTPMLIPDLVNVKQITAGVGTALALLNDGTVKTWGGNYEHRTPALVSDLVDVQWGETFESGAFFVRLSNGVIKTWAYNSTPVLVPDLVDVKKIIAGKISNFAFLNDGTVKAWGINSSGQLGLGDKVDRATPTLVNEFVGAKQIAAGFNYSLALMKNGTVKVCGKNNKGQLGIGNTPAEVTMPMQHPGFAKLSRFLYLKDNAAYAGQENLRKVAENFTMLQVADKKALFMAADAEIAVVNEIAKLGVAKIMAYLDAPVMAKPACTISAIPYQMIQQNLTESDGLIQATITTNLTGSSTVKLIATTDGNTYKTFKDDAWQDIDHTDFAAVAANGIDSAALASITAEQWSAVLGGSKNIGFAYLLDMYSAIDTCIVDQLNLKFVTSGRWDMATPCTDYSYAYANKSLLQVTLFTDGNYKINYQD